MDDKKFPPSGSCVSGNLEDISGCFPKDHIIKEEEEALAVLRELKAQVHVEKARIVEIKQGLEADAEDTKLHGELKACEEKLQELRIKWDEWDQKRQAATRVKLIRLGHIRPDDPY